LGNSDTYHTTRRHIPEECNYDIHYAENLNSKAQSELFKSYLEHRMTSDSFQPFSTELELNLFKNLCSYKRTIRDVTAIGEDTNKHGYLELISTYQQDITT